MPHLKRSSTTGHLLRNADGHLVHTCDDTPDPDPDCECCEEGTIPAGAVQIEFSADPSYSDDWIFDPSLTTITSAAVLSSCSALRVDGLQIRNTVTAATSTYAILIELVYDDPEGCRWEATLEVAPVPPVETYAHWEGSYSALKDCSEEEDLGVPADWADGHAYGFDFSGVNLTVNA